MLTRHFYLTSMINKLALVIVMTFASAVVQVSFRNHHQRRRATAVSQINGSNEGVTSGFRRLMKVDYQIC
jgi:ribosomal protein L6P/L9E